MRFKLSAERAAAEKAANPKSLAISLWNVNGATGYAGRPPLAAVTIPSCGRSIRAVQIQATCMQHTTHTCCSHIAELAPLQKALQRASFACWEGSSAACRAQSSILDISTTSRTRILQVHMPQKQERACSKAAHTCRLTVTGPR